MQQGSKVSAGFYQWSRNVPREYWDPNDPVLLEAGKQYMGIENTIGYTFRDKGFLLQAFTHASFPEPARIVPGFMRPMDFLGSALLRGLTSVHLYGSVEKLTPHELSETRQHLECDRFVASVVVRHEMHRLLRSASCALNDAVVRYVQYVEGHKDEAVPQATPPGPLADMFRALAGAIYLDSDQNLAGMYGCIFKLLQPNIEHELARRANH
ncbi:uncharacterized protein LOC144168648 [Haemaphysalis longicornis]